MRLEPRKIAVATAGFCAFLNLYSPQALLPALSREFGVGAAEISMIMTEKKIGRPTVRHGPMTSSVVSPVTLLSPKCSLR